MKTARAGFRTACGPPRLARGAWLWAALLLGVAMPLAASGQSAHVLVVTGVAGGPDYRARFAAWADTFLAAAREGGVAPEHIIYLAERPDQVEGADGRSAATELESAIERIRAAAAPGDRVFILLIGHGSFRDGEARFNLPGPDLTASRFAELVGRLADQTVVFVNAASASGPFVEALSGPGRVVVSATKTGRERNATVFARYFTAAFRGGAADFDKDGRVSVLEAFRFARLEVAREYEQDGRLVTEHALLDDDGDGHGSDALTDGAPDGARAGSLYLARATGDRAAATGPVEPELRRLLDERAALQRRVDELRARRSEMSADAYDRALEEILVQLALVSRQIRQREGGGP
ncbi:MAG: hypothetical protein D6701_02155 [Gemmatimonadetes bacterium]|nr:MAG: hypothetical protein D6701_02155 [Gemmatimonadota bacterium]